MGEIIKIGHETIRYEELERVSQKILNILKEEKRTYRVNKSILKYSIDKLEREIEATIFY